MFFKKKFGFYFGIALFHSATITAQDAAFLNTPTAARISRLFLTIPIRTSVTSSAFPMPMTSSTFRAAQACSSP